MIKTKIIATVGPASAEAGTLKDLLDAGVDVFRLNFSHGTIEQHAELLKSINSVRASHNRTTALMGDLCGPKIRVGRIESEGELLRRGDKVAILTGDEPGYAHNFYTNYKDFSKDVKVGQQIFIDDGRISLRVIGIDEQMVLCEVMSEGPVYSNKGINLPDTDVSTSAITERDWHYIDWAVKNDLDFLALSFVRTADEVMELKRYLSGVGSDIKVIAKIEKPQAVNCLGKIIEVSDGVLVARGDLGIEMDLAEVPLVQKRTTDMCRYMGKPVIVATQMLQSMIDNPVATRAEVSDVANAIMDYCDAVMLSGETSIGKYPLEAVRTISRISRVTEAYLDKHDQMHPRTTTTEDLRQTESISRSVGYIVDDIEPKLVVVWSQSGSSARLLSKARIDVPILALSSNQKVCRQMCLDYGVIPYCMPVPNTFQEFVDTVNELLLSSNRSRVGDKIVIVAGQPLGEPGGTNIIAVHTVTGT
jgi:pyruvate kinase